MSIWVFLKFKSGKKRLILDLSSPHNDAVHPSINDLIDKESSSLSYVNRDFESIKNHCKDSHCSETTCFRRLNGKKVI
jgi:hypothetical protein